MTESGFKPRYLGLRAHAHNFYYVNRMKSQSDERRLFRTDSEERPLRGRHLSCELKDESGPPMK